MMGLLRRVGDRLLGRGEAAVTVPIFDGALKPNQLLEEARVVAEFTEATDLATDGHDLYVVDGSTVLRLAEDGSQSVVARASGPLTALALMPGNQVAVAIGGREVAVLEGERVVRSWREAGGQALLSVNALCATPAGALLATEGSQQHDESQWQRDLLSNGKSGRILAFDPEGPGRVLASRLAWPFGIVADSDDSYVYSESWAHRSMQVQGASSGALLDHLPGYPSRLAAAAGGGYWLTVFAARTQMIEFVLREPSLRNRMLAEIDPRYWIAPAYASGRSFLEPLQGAGIKQMGVLKPWAPPRSYGLLVRLNPQGLPLYSLHSRVGGTHHGIVAAAECHNRLYALSRGAGRVIAVDLSAVGGNLT